MPKRGSLFCRYSTPLVESSADVKTTSKKVSLRLVNKWVKPGKFFPESMLKKRGMWSQSQTSAIKCLVRSSLPQSIASKLWCPVIRAWDQEVCFLCGLRFEPCGCSYDGHWRLTWSLTSGPVGLVEVRTNWSGHPR